MLARRWRGKWWQVLGDFSGQDVSACCLAFKVPCVAWAWNQQRALQNSFVRELLRFVALSFALVMGTQIGCCLVMALLCPQATPPPPHKHGGESGACSARTCFKPRWLLCTLSQLT